ncbi:unnamed protein product, partial [marine sediment metagenome]
TPDGPGELLWWGTYASTRTQSGRMFFSRYEYEYVVELPDVPVDAGIYFVGIRTVGDVEFSYLLVTDQVLGQGQGYYRCAEQGYPDFVPLDTFTANPKDLGFKVYGHPR